MPLHTYTNHRAALAIKDVEQQRAKQIQSCLHFGEHFKILNQLSRNNKAKATELPDWRGRFYRGSNCKAEGGERDDVRK